MKIRIPITVITVFGAAALVALAVGIVLYLGLGSAMKNTRMLMTIQAETFISAMEHGINVRLRPIKTQAEWIARHVTYNPDSSRTFEDYDDFMIGTLAATPQVAGIAIVTPDGLSRRWTRATREGITEDWSSRHEVMEWAKGASERTDASWIDPFFTETVNSTVLLRDYPLYTADNQFIGVLAQIVPIAELSREIVDGSSRAGMTPFILYGRDRVLAHPKLVFDTGNGVDDDTPLPSLKELGDVVLQNIWSPQEDELFFVDGGAKLNATGSFIPEFERFFVYLYRELNDYGPTPWTFGVHINTDLYGGAEGDRLTRALVGSIIVLILASLIAMWLGRRVTRPITAIANAAKQVEANQFAQITELPPTRVRELDDASRSINKMVVDLRERALIRETLGRFVPEAVARTLLSEGGTMEPEIAEATLLYSDIENFTALTETLGPTRIVDVLNAYFSSMVEILERHDGVVTQFQGDAILATFNVPIKNAQHAANAIRAATEMLRVIENQQYDQYHLQIRIGINTGSVVAGAVGAAGRLSYTVHGDSVNLAARLESLNKQFNTRLLVSEHSVSLTNELQLKPIGETAVRGQTHKVKLFTLPSPS